jgi:ATP-dependent DNA helicase DinG
MSSYFTLEDFTKNFPFETIRPKQLEVLQQVCDTLNAGYKYIVLEAPTGFGKSAVAIAISRTLGSSYICTATKNLQSQYTNDFPFLRSVKGMSGFVCLVREDHILNNSYACDKCKINQVKNLTSINSIQECDHKAVSFGPCRDDQVGYHHFTKECGKCVDIKAGVKKKPFIADFHDGCRYRTFKEDYEKTDPNTDYEDIILKSSRAEQYLKFSTNLNWVHMTNVANPAVFNVRTKEFTPCSYYDQLNKGIVASHTIFNYANFLIFQRFQTSNVLREKELLVLDEGHLIEERMISYVGVTIERWRLQRYMHTAPIEYTKLHFSSSIKDGWLPFLSGLYDALKELIESGRLQREIRIEAKEYLQKLEFTISEIDLDPGNWIVSNIERDDKHDPNSRIKSISFKPLDISRYCQRMFTQCNNTLIMSATILDADAFCKSVGLERSKVKFIQADSDFPVENRPVYNLSITKLNMASMSMEKTQRQIANGIDQIMNAHKEDKGIIHVMSYPQVNFIRKYLSRENNHRLIATDQENMSGEEAMAKHTSPSNDKPTVLISPALHLGIDLKDDLSRFQIVVKVPYGDLGDRWIKAKLDKDQAWYNWKTALTFVQACGRSIRSKDDYAVTYLLDSLFERFIDEYKSKLPGWFRDAIMSRSLKELTIPTAVAQTAATTSRSDG